jgi:hypothetical protein
MIAFNLVLCLLAVGGLALVVRLAHTVAAQREETSVMRLAVPQEVEQERKAA